MRLRALTAIRVSVVWVSIFAAAQVEPDDLFVAPNLSFAT